MTNISYTILQNRQKMYTKAYAGLCLVLFVCIGFYSYQKWQEYSEIKYVVTKNEEFLTTLREEASDEKASYESQKENFNNLNKEIEEKLSYIFPAIDEYTVLTRQIDSFEEDLSKANDPFEISNIEYQEGIKTENYSILPLRMTIKSSADNFKKFLHLMENSGSLIDQIRLMDISSIKLNFADLDNGENTLKMINFTVQLNAYFQ